MTRIRLILALALALAGVYSASAQRNFGGFGGRGRNFNGNDNFGYGPGNDNGNFGYGGRSYNNYYSSAQSTNVPGPTEYSKFSSFIALRNIFNPDRYPSVGPRPTPPGPPPPSPTFGLVGTMAYEKGRFAFFDGNSPEYQKVLYASDSNRIAGFIVSDVTPAGVTLQTADKKQSQELKIGQSLRQQEDGTWNLGGGTESFSSASMAGSPMISSGMAPGATAAGAPTAAAGAPLSTPAPSAAIQGNDILRRLMQERQQQLK